MRLKEVISVATAVSINGLLANEFEPFGEFGFSVNWCDGKGATYTGEDVANAKFHDGTFIINNDVVEFYILTPLPTVG